MSADNLTAARILRVNHAGEIGAIRIYRAQLSVINILYKDLSVSFNELLRHEIEHCRAFRAAMPSRGIIPCYSLWVWSLGGYVLGLLTALMGRNTIMVCTEAVEDAVHRHLLEQAAFLDGRDPELKNLIENIKMEELAHLDFARTRVRHSTATRALCLFIDAATSAIIWLSTRGAPTFIAFDMKRAAVG
jgi:ubiquinone biosynthesis monooxygenase Coq7